jgi:hypothetical protein
MYHIAVHPAAHRRTVVDGTVMTDDLILLQDDGAVHTVIVEHPRASRLPLLYEAAAR